MDIIKDEKGLVFGIVISIVAMGLLVLSLLAVLGHVWWNALIFFLLGVLIYPITSKIRDRIVKKEVAA